MAHQILWNKPIVEEFISLASLSREEEMILKTRIQGMTRIQQSMEFGMSVATVDRIIHRLKIKYDNVQQFSDLLPERQKTDVFR